jgi:transcriptional regulator with XRE-family HTH domain
MAAFGRLDDAALGRLLGDLSKRQISRLKSGEVTPSVDQLELVAHAAGAPLWFVRYGFAPPAGAVDRSVHERLDVLERQVEELRKGDAPR